MKKIQKLAATFVALSALCLASCKNAANSGSNSSSNPETSLSKYQFPSALIGTWNFAAGGDPTIEISAYSVKLLTGVSTSEFRLLSEAGGPDADGVYTLKCSIDGLGEIFLLIRLDGAGEKMRFLSASAESLDATKGALIYGDSWTYARQR